MENNIRTGRIVAVLVLGMFIAILNQTLINVAIPHMMNDLNVSTSTIQWLSTGFMLANAVLIPISAFLIETFTTRKLFMAAMIFFTAGSLICGIAPNYTLVLIGRLVQAVGAGILMPMVSNVFLRVFPPEKLGKAMGLMGIAMMFAPAIGPTLSGWIVENYSWRILFYIMVPLGVFEILLAAAWLTNISKLTFPKFDFSGALFSMLGFGGILYGLSEAGDKGWSSVWVIAPIYSGFFFLVLFIRRELTTDQPLVDLRVFKFDVYNLTTIVSMIVNMAMYGGMLLLPIYIQNIRGFTPLQSGLLLLPGAILMGIMSPISGALFDKIGIRPLAIVGLAITTVTTYQFSKLTAETTYTYILFLYAMRMFGMSFIMMTIMTAGFNQLPVHLKSHGNAMSNTLRQVAGSIGTALLVTVMSTRSTIHLTNYANEVTTNNSYAVETLTNLGQGLAAAAGLPLQAGGSLGIPIIYQSAAVQASINGINDAFIVATVLTVIALVISFFIKRKRA